jgi:hypothetical protein
MNSAPAHLKPLLTTIRAMKIPGPPARTAKLQSLLTRVILERLGTIPKEVDTGWALSRGRSFVLAAGRYVTEMGGYPLSLKRVVHNTGFQPRIWTEDAVKSVGEGRPELLTAPGGLYFADPVSVVLSAAYPRKVKAVSDRKSGKFVSLVEFAHTQHSADFVWDVSAFPAAAVQLDNNDLLILHSAKFGRLGWTRVEAVHVPKNPRVFPPLISTAQHSGPGRKDEVTSALKGARGEALVRALIQGKTGYTVTDVSHLARSADMIVSTPSGEVYVDVKDYAVSVPVREVEKFHKDLGVRGASSGVLVSLSANIVGVKGTLTASMVAVPYSGQIVPVVYVASRHEDVLAAAIDMAAFLSKIYPGTVPKLHPRDSLESYLDGYERVSDLIEGSRAELMQLVSTIGAKMGVTIERLGAALRDQRTIVQAQKAEIESVEDVAPEGSGGMWKVIKTKYSPPPITAPILKEVLRALETGTRLGDIQDKKRWRLLATKAIHTATGSVLGFLKSRTTFGRPAASMASRRIADLISRHPKKVRYSDGVITLDVSNATAVDLIGIAST